MESNFYKYYDLLFRSKGYQEETDLIFKLSEEYGIDNPQKILEIGCGTGNHTQVLYQRDISIVAIDNDPQMIKLSQDKLKQTDKLKIIYTNIEDLKEDNFDLSLAMFNVITYIPTTSDLDSFIQSVYQRLKKGGIFVFDLWNGIAAIKDPPLNKKTEIEDNGEKIEVILTPTTDFFNQKTTLKYEIKEESFSFTQTLWTPMQITDSLKKASFELILCSPLMDYEKQATEKDWKVMFVAKKN